MSENTNAGNAGTQDLSQERKDLLAELGKARGYLRFTARGLTDDQARQRTTVSELTIGGLIKHVSYCERSWREFIVGGPAPGPKDYTNFTEEDRRKRAEGFRLLGGETLSGVLAQYEEVAKATDELIASLPDLNASRELPPAPWFAPGARWSHRQTLLHIIGETTQHAGHADIIRESVDGQKTMG